MTIYELAERDLRKAEVSLAMAKKRLNVPVAELEHIENLCRLRKEILEIMGNAPNKQSEGEWIDKPTGAYGRMQSWCSACGKHSGIGGIESNRHKPYCPNCGAKMKGGEE